MTKEKQTRGKTTIYNTLHRKDRADKTPLKTGDELKCSGMARSSCSTCCTLRVTLAANPVVISQYFRYMVTVRFIDGYNLSIWRKP